MNLVLRKYFWILNHPLKYCTYSLKSNEIVNTKKPNFEGNIKCPTYKFRFTKKFVGRAIINQRKQQHVCLFRNT